MAHKKGQGSSRNGRESESKRLGVKLFGGQTAIPGNILVRQRGTKFHAGTGVGMGKDHTLFAKEVGLVSFSTKKGNRRYISVLPVEAEAVVKEVVKKKAAPKKIAKVEEEPKKAPAEKKEAASKGEEAVPDWMDSALAEAAQRSEISPAMSPPPVDERENNYFNRGEEEIRRQERIWDLLIVAFILCCFAGLTAVLVYGV